MGTFTVHVINVKILPQARIVVSGRVTRNSHLLKVPCFKSATRQRTFLYRTVSLLNDLDDTFQLCESVFIFKRK